MTAIFIRDAYADVPTTQRGRMTEELRRLKVQSWADPGDADLRERIAALEAELAAFDVRGAAR
jgi:hypothetical protein